MFYILKGVFLSLCLKGMFLSGWFKILTDIFWLYSYMCVLFLPGSILRDVPSSEHVLLRPRWQCSPL